MKLDSNEYPNTTKTFSFRKLSKGVMLSAFSLFSFCHSYAQCYTNSLNVSTGWDPKAGTLITGGINSGTPVPDPYWTVYAVNAQVYSALTPGDIVSTGAADVIQTYYSWISLPACNFISCENTNLPTTNGSGIEYYGMVLNRFFNVCPNGDDIHIHLNIADDNYAALYIDGNATSFAQPVGLGSWYTATIFDTIIYMPPGKHLLSFVVNNYNNNHITNAWGLGVEGTVYSATSTNSLVSESFSACDAVSCGGYSGGYVGLSGDVIMRTSSPNLGVAATNAGTDNNMMYQNAPNPFNTKTTIKYHIAKTTTNAVIIVTDLVGRKINSYPVNTKGDGSISIQDMAPGTYLYTLVVDGVAADTKRMIVVN